MSKEQQQLEAGMAALEAQRALLGDAVVDSALGPMRARLAALRSMPLATPPDPTQTLKQVSILFLDVVGSTTLSQRLDPEATGEVMDGALSRGTALVAEHHGKVLQYAGDNILAVFGADESREDDAERAVRCGLALLALGKVLGAEVQAAHGHAGFDVRVGIHTGGVLLGGGVDEDGSIRGIAVNIAARMEQTAPAGALRISHDTYAQVRGLFDVDAQEPLTVKGVDTPVQSYLVKAAKPRNFRIGTRGIEGVATKMIGRDAELEQLQAAFKRLFETRKLAAVSVVADAGIGKSRLLYEFEAWSEARPESFFLFRGRATPQTGAQAFGLLRDIVAWRFQIQDDDSIEAARQKMENGVMPLFLHDDGPDLAEAHAHLLGHLIGIEWKSSRHIKGILDDPRQIRNRAFHAAAQLFRRVGASDGSPVVLQLEDLHWADDESLDFLNYLAEVNRDVPLLVLSFTRPTLFERRSDWSSTAGLHQRIDLVPLDKTGSRMLANELLKKLPEVPAALRELVTSSAEGNPFYMEELVKMLIDQGAIRTGSGSGEAWSVNAERLLVTQVPATLTGVLQARLDGLPQREKRALQQASVIGTVFWDQALAAIEAQAAEALPALVQRELALPRSDASLDGLRADLREYAFRHQVLHQVTYDTVLKRDKREGHAKVAQWLAALTEQGSPRAGDFLGIAAEHFEQAGDAPNAAEFHARAAEQAGQRFAHDRVLAHVGRALALLGDTVTPAPDQAELRWRLLHAREQTLSLHGRRDEQAADLDAMDSLAELLDDDRRRAYAARRRSGRAMRMADWVAMESAARHGLAYATRAGDDELRLHALRVVAVAQIYQGDIEGGRTLAQQGLAEARSLGLRVVEQRMLNALAVAADMQGDLMGAMELDPQNLLICREIGDRVAESNCLYNQGEGKLKLGDLAQARRDFDAALHMGRALGDRSSECAALTGLSIVALWQGEETRALALARQALDIAVASKARDMEVLAALRLGAAELTLGRRAAAREACAQARALAVEIDFPLQHDASAGLARVALADGDPASAVAALQPLLDHIAASGTLDGTEYPRLIELSCHQTLAGAQDPRAADWLTRAHSALMAQADAISRGSSDATLRQGFLKNIPHHREIVAAWAKRDVASEVPAMPRG
ncbi:MAG: adenylate/guanylate cyclase domain-containing protein [Burkholderiales bacterium]